jgi:hypothetical protein
MGISLAEDVGKLLQHPALAQAALLDASRVVRAALVEVLQMKKDTNEGGGEEEEEDLAKLLASKLHLDKKDSSKSATNSKEDKARRTAGKKLLRVWHKLRFFLQWSLGFTSLSGSSENENKDREWESLRAEYLAALKEQQDAVAGAGMMGKQKKEKEKMVVL